MSTLLAIKPKNNGQILSPSIKEQNKSIKTNISSIKTQAQTIQTNSKENFANKEDVEDYIKNNYPTFFENFELCNYIGSGSSGNVFQAFYKSNKRSVAIKFIKNKYDKDKAKMNLRIRQEMSISTKLHHKNIMETYAHLKINDDFSFCVLEYGKNGDLEYFVHNLLKRRIISETTVNYFAKQILEGLEYLHKKCKIVHMDIKPGNILIDSSLQAKIADFSVSCSFGNFEPNTLVKFPFVGTAKFMSPEIINKENMKIKDSEKIDMYSFGATLYFLFYGIYPYNLHEIKVKDYTKIYEQIQKENLDFPKERKISSLFKDFLGKCLDKNYKTRIGIKEALNHPWIKASKAIFDEKENLGCLENFLIKLITDNIASFNELIK